MLRLSCLSHNRKARILLYFQSVISEDVETQKHGVVIIFAAGEEFGEQIVGEYNEDILNILKNPPYRVAVCHQSLLNGPKYRFLNAVWFLVVTSKDERVRTKFHGDLSLQKTQYELLSFGIPVHQIPRTSTGKIKIKNHLQWIYTRIAIDLIRKSSPGDTGLDCRIIGHPRRHDVLFSRGGNASSPGNAEFVDILSERLAKFISNPDREFRQKVRDEIVASVESRNGRFLQFQKGGWWEELCRDKIDDKITNCMYNYQKKLAVMKLQQSTRRDTSVFLSSNKLQRVVNNSMNCGWHF